MPFIPFEDWIATLLQMDESPDRKKVLLEAQILAQSVIDKLKGLGFTDISPMIDVKNTMGLEEAAIFYQSLSSTEAIRLLMIADFKDLEGSWPTLFDLAEYKTDKPTRDDAANEGRIINQLEENEFITVFRSGGDLASDDTIGLTSDGKEVVNEFIQDSTFLTKLYRRSRSPKIREFLLNYLEGEQKSSLI